MRLWSIHPQYLDTKGLLAVWREGLLAKKVLQGKTRGYRNHPQLIRFKRAQRPMMAINAYLKAVYCEAVNRGYHFNERKIGRAIRVMKIPVTQGQLKYETGHLLKKLLIRDAERYFLLSGQRKLVPHPLFRVIQGERESWEKNGQKERALPG